MTSITGFISLLFFLSAAWLLVQATKPRSIEAAFIYFFGVYSTLVVTSGFLLSNWQLLASPPAWLSTSLLYLIIAIVIGYLSEARFLPPLSPNLSLIKQQFFGLNIWEKAIFIWTLSTLLLANIIRLFLIVNIAPFNWDSMTYHLPRMVYYLQQGHLGSFNTNYWAQVIHPKISTILMIHTYVASGGNENCTPLPQYAAYLACIFAVYGIVRLCGYRRLYSFVTAGIYGLLTENLLEAGTTQNDLIMTAYIGGVIFSFLAFRKQRQYLFLFFGALFLGLAVGVKGSVVLVFPSLVLVIIFSLFAASGMTWRRLWVGCAFATGASIVMMTLLALPSGYYQNWRSFGHAIAPPIVRQMHSFDGQPASYIFRNGTLNLCRFASEFISLDGLPSTCQAITSFQTFSRQSIGSATSLIGLNLTTNEAVRSPYIYDKAPIINEDFSYWGPLGFMLLWPAVFLAILGVIRNKTLRVLAYSSLVFVVVQSYSGPYDPWRGRYFIACAVFSAPIAVAWLTSSRVSIKCWVSLALLLGGLGAINTAYQSGGELFSNEQYRNDRIRQLSYRNQAFYNGFKKFEAEVPTNATVAMSCGWDVYEYPLLGAKFSRHLIHVQRNETGQFPVPADCQYLIVYENDPLLKQTTNYWHLGREQYVIVLQQ